MHPLLGVWVLGKHQEAGPSSEPSELRAIFYPKEAPPRRCVGGSPSNCQQLRGAGEPALHRWWMERKQVPLRGWVGTEFSSVPAAHLHSPITDT